MIVQGEKGQVAGLALLEVVEVAAGLPLQLGKRPPGRFSRGLEGGRDLLGLCSVLRGLVEFQLLPRCAVTTAAAAPAGYWLQTTPEKLTGSCEV